MKVAIHEASELIETYIRAKLVPLIKGSPGIGKSQIVQAIAKKFKLKLIDLRLAQCDPVDLMGFATIDKDTGKGRYAPMETFPLEGDPIPADYNGWLLFMDELTSANRSIQAAAYKIILDRMVGMEHLHKNVAVVAAGNLDTDNAIVEEMSSALKSRMVHIEVEVDAVKWADWASANGFHRLITAYINGNNDKLFTFKPDSTDDTYCCPRTWEFVNRIIPFLPPTEQNVAAYAGAIGEGEARTFIAFCAMEALVPKLNQILNNPKLIAVPDEPSILWLLCGDLSKAIDEHNVDAMMTFINRIPLEFQVVCVRQMDLAKKPKVRDSAAIKEWVKVNGAELF